MSEFIQSLPGCEEHGKVFKDEVSVRLYCNMFLNVSSPEIQQWGNVLSEQAGGDR